MAEVKKLDLEDPPPILDDEDEETLAAIDEGIEDDDAGRLTPIAEVRSLFSQWITAYSSRKGR
jgi:predicted transcriptional regulator